MVADWETGQIKLHVIRALLRLRRELAGVFCNVSSVPLDASGPRGSLVAWCRRPGAPLCHRGDSAPHTRVRRAWPLPHRDPALGNTACLIPKSAPPSSVDVSAGRTIAATRGRIDIPSALGVLPIAVLREADS